MSTQTTPPQESKPSKSTITKNNNPWKWLTEHKLFMLAVVPVLATIGIVSDVSGVYELANENLYQWQFQRVTGQIKGPLDEATVPAKVTFEGDISNLPKDSSLWLFIYADGIKKYYPYELQPDAEKGNWRIQDVEIGMPNANRGDFRAELFLVGKNKSEEFRKRVSRRTVRTERKELKERGLDARPEGRELAAIDIRRAVR